MKDAIQEEAKNKKFAKIKKRLQPYKEKLYEYLRIKSKDARDALLLAEVASQYIQTAFYAQESEQTVKSLDFTKEIQAMVNDERCDQIAELVEDLTVSEADIIISGMAQAIDGQNRIDLKTKKLDDLNIDLS